MALLSEVESQCEPLMLRRDELAVEVQEKERSALQEQPRTVLVEEKKRTVAQKIGQSLVQTGRASIGVLIRYFKIVDILINFFGKVNVARSERMEKWVEYLQSLRFPALNFYSDESEAQKENPDEPT